MKSLAVAVGVGSLFLASPAQAATGYDRCPVDRMCVFTEPNGGGAIGIFANGDVDLSDSVGPTGLNNNIESMRNRTSGHFCFYTEINYNGLAWRGGPGGGANTVPAATNTISSLKRC
jgi:hypothetical protein